MRLFHEIPHLMVNCKDYHADHDQQSSETPLSIRVLKTLILMLFPYLQTGEIGIGSQ